MEKHRAIPRGFMTVGELAKKMNTTVRTLQYYDREGLLSPSAESEGGRRLYTDKDIIRLHQIQSMKYLGFSLGDIKKPSCIARNTSRCHRCASGTGTGGARANYIVVTGFANSRKTLRGNTANANGGLEKVCRYCCQSTNEERALLDGKTFRQRNT